MGLVNANGCRLWYELKGAETPIVYVHGGFACLAYWLQTQATPAPPTESVLRRSWEIDFIAHHLFLDCDRRGCYRSPPIETGYELETQADDLAALLVALNMDAAHSPHVIRRRYCRWSWQELRSTCSPRTTQLLRRSASR